MGSVDRTRRPVERPAHETATAGKHGQPSRSARPTGRGSIGDDAVLRLDPVMKDRRVATLMQVLKEALQQTAPGFDALSLKRDKGQLYYVISRLLPLVTGGDLSDTALRKGTETLANTYFADPTLRPHEATDYEETRAQAHNLRAAADAFRMEMALQNVTMTMKPGVKGTAEARNRLMQWLSPYPSEENPASQGESAFRRLVVAAKLLKEGAGPDAAARLMAWAFQSGVMPISISVETDSGLKVLWSCLRGAQSADLVGAQKLLNLYRDAIDRESTKTK
jgi:hypothetical protein